MSKCIYFFGIGGASVVDYFIGDPNSLYNLFPILHWSKQPCPTQTIVLCYLKYVIVRYLASNFV